jgi:hypothetical protein
MAKRRLKVHFRLPEYVSPRGARRQEIPAVAEHAFIDARIAIAWTDKIELERRPYLGRGALETHDVDNRLKDVMDALQGLVQGKGKKQRDRSPLLPSDSQVFRVVVEKTLPPKNSHGLGHVVLRRYKPKSRAAHNRDA